MAQNSLLLQLAQDPATPLLTLQQLAQEYPGLRPAIALNPSTYPALLGWLANLHDPAVDAALAQRAAGGPPAPPPPGVTPSTGGASDGGARGSGARELGGNPLFPPTQSLPVTAAGGGGILDFEDDEEPSGGGALPWVIGGLAVVLVLVILYVVFTLFGPAKPARPEVADAMRTSSQLPQETAAPTQAADSASPTPTPSTSTQLRPAPADALDFSAFYTPSQNIGCSLEGEAAWCVMYEHYETTSAGCGPDEPVIVTIDAQGNISEECASAEGDLPTLNYGESTANEKFACVSKESGVDCWHLATGRGFVISREGIFKK
ncbi:MAG: hypothetical protein Q3999_00170 [Buchananella hordeovulneris]|nr:hypothetical protein [Buchananella hordeovulneris]